MHLYVSIFKGYILFFDFALFQLSAGVEFDILINLLIFSHFRRGGGHMLALAGARSAVGFICLFSFGLLSLSLYFSRPHHSVLARPIYILILQSIFRSTLVVYAQYSISVLRVRYSHAWETSAPVAADHVNYPLVTLTLIPWCASGKSARSPRTARLASCFFLSRPIAGQRLFRWPLRSPGEPDPRAPVPAAFPVLARSAADLLTRPSSAKDSPCASADHFGGEF